MVGRVAGRGVGFTGLVAGSGSTIAGGLAVGGMITFAAFTGSDNVAIPCDGLLIIVIPPARGPGTPPSEIVMTG
jgi:hypothetical protein